MTTITLSPEVAEVLRREAERTGHTPDAIADEWLRQYHAREHRQQLAEQIEHFWAKHAELYSQYANQHVAFYNEAVLDHDADLSALALRVQTHYPDLPIVIAPVTEEPQREFQVISTRLPVVLK